jgi:hypothetical protein
MSFVDYYAWLLSGPQLSKDDLGVYQRLRLALRANFLNPTRDEIQWLKKLSYGDLRKIFSIDPSGESKILLLKNIVDRTNTADDILGLFQDITEWRKTANGDDASLFMSQVQSTFGGQFRWKFLDLAPNDTQLLLGLQFGLFDNQEELFWSALLPQITEQTSLMEVWKNHWRPYLRSHPELMTSELDNVKRLRPSMIAFYKRGLSLNPNFGQNESFVGLPSPVKIGVQSQNIQEPLAFMKELSEFFVFYGLRKTLRVWSLRRAILFSLEPTVIELIEMFKIELPALVKAELLTYATQKLVIRRISEWNALMHAATDIQEFRKDTPENIDHFNVALLDLVDLFLKNDPPINEYSRLFQSKAFRSPIQKVQLLKHLAANFHSLSQFTAINGQKNLSSEINRVIVENPSFLRRYQSSHNEVLGFITMMERYPAGYLVFKDYVNTHPKDFNFVLQVLKTKIKTHASEDFEFLDPIWLNAFYEFEKTGPTFSALLSLKLAAISPRTYRVLLESLLQKVSTFSGLEQIVMTHDDDWLTPLSPMSRDKILEVNDELVPAKFKELYPVSSLNWSIDTFVRSSQNFTRAASVLQIFDQLVHKGLPGPGNESFLHIKSHFSDNQSYDYKIALALYFIFEFETMLDSRNKWPGDIGFQIMYHLTSQYQYEILGLRSNEELVLQLNRVFTLKSIKALVESADYRSGSDQAESQFRQITSVSYQVDGSEISQKLKKQQSQIKERYKSYPSAYWQELTQREKTTPKSRAELEAEIDQEILDSKEVINEGLLRMPKWRTTLEETLGRKVLISDEKKRRLSCQVAVAH